MNISKSDYEVTKKVLNSLSRLYNNTVAPILDEHMYPEKMTLDSIVEFFDIYDSVAGGNYAFFMLQQMSLQPKNNDNREECYSVPKAGARKAKPRKGECFQCGERGHKARDCKRKIQQQVAKEAEMDEEEEIGVDYLMLVEEIYGEFSFDEDLWMIYAKSTTSHMTPHERSISRR